MISRFSSVLNLNNMMNRLPALVFRNKTNSAVPSSKSVDSTDPDMPIEMEDPYKKKKRVCILCKFNIDPDYKNVRLLSQFQSRHTGRVYSKHITGLCEHKQKRVEQEIKKAQHAGLMGYMTKDPKFVHDPKLFDPAFPFRPHKY